MTLRMTPRLASWDAAASVSQARLAAYLSDTEQLMEPVLRALRSPWTLRLDVGLPEGKDLLDVADLDNYLYPLARYLTRPAGLVAGVLVSAWCTKKHADQSLIRAEPARPVAGPTGGVYSVRTTAAASTTAYKRQIRNAVSGATEMQAGGVRLEISFLVGNRNWLNLWKATIDALDPLLGRTRESRDWHPRDGRITELGLHLANDSMLGYDVGIMIEAQPTTDTGDDRR